MGSSSRSATVGTLLADIANSISDSLRILNLSDKRHWGEEEHDQVRALEDVLDEARKDFQEMSPLVNGQFQYENDRKCTIAARGPPPPSSLRIPKEDGERHTQRACGG